jgi:Tfp pilus assembly protein PilF
LHIYLINAKLDKARAMLVVALRLWTTEGADTDTAARLDQEIRKAYFAEYKVGGDEALEPLRATLEAAMEEVAFAPAGKPGQGGSIPVGLLLACLCEGAGKLDKARATYERLLSQHSGDVDVKRAYGLLLVRLQLMPEAAKVLGDVAAARPGDSVVLQSLGAAYTVLKKTDDALKTLMLVTEIQGLPTPERIGVETQIAGIYHSQGRFVQAAERWEKVWPLGENPDQQAELQLAAALEQNLAGNTNRAKELYNLVLAGPASQGLKDRARDGLSKQEQKKG